jgi:hypothetical protein
VSIETTTHSPSPYLSWARADHDIQAYTVEVWQGTLTGTRFTRVVLRPGVAVDAELGDERVESLHRRARRQSPRIPAVSGTNSR